LVIQSFSSRISHSGIETVQRSTGRRISRPPEPPTTTGPDSIQATLRHAKKRAENGDFSLIFIVFCAKT
jgi:hypothetical protein